MYARVYLAFDFELGCGLQEVEISNDDHDSQIIRDIGVNCYHGQ